MALNGTEWMSEPFNTTFSPFTDLFADFIGVGLGHVFFLFPIVVITYTLYVKTEGDGVMTSMFMIATGALMSSMELFTGMYVMSVVFLIFAALGLTGLFISFLFQR